MIHHKKSRQKSLDWRTTLSSLAIGASGATLFGIIGFPSAPLTGSAAAVTVVSLFGIKTEIPILVRNAAFILLGVNIGTAATPELLANAVQWPFSLIILLVSLVVGILLTRLGLKRIFNYEHESATLAAVPGHLSYVLSLSLERNTDTAQIAIVQSVRVLFITLVAPPFIVLGFGATSAVVLPDAVMSPWHILLAFGGAFIVGLLFTRAKIPAAFLLAGMIVTALLQLTETTSGRLPEALSFLSFLIMGTLIGSRFSNQTLRTIRVALGAGLWVTGVNFSVAILGTVALSFFFDLSAAQIFVAFVPGGVEAMAAMALMLGIDPTYVAAHHLARLIFLTFLIPLMLSLKETGR